jgi:hypothetical protein
VLVALQLQVPPTTNLAGSTEVNGKGINHKYVPGTGLLLDLVAMLITDVHAKWTAGLPAGKEAHRVRVQTRVRFQRRGFRSPIQARTPESESKEEPDLLWTRESESKEESDLPLDSRVRVQGRVRFAFGLQSPSPRESPICFGPESPTESESKGASPIWQGVYLD